MTHFTPFDESYPKVSVMPVWRQKAMLERAVGIPHIAMMGLGAEDLEAMEVTAAALQREAARQAPAAEAARLKAMGIEPQQTNWTWFIPWPTQRPAAA
ncbi:MAG: hypothetical protein EBQ96_06555 [Proteobacteria bacterium]|nr:hypothetical protein [Pseudomonadota bacterium]